MNNWFLVKKVGIIQTKKHITEWEKIFANYSWLMGCKIVHSLWKSMWWYFKKMGMDITQNPAILLCHIPKWYFILQERNLLNYGHCYSIYNSQKWKTIQIYLNRWMHEENVVHLNSRLYFAIKLMDLIHYINSLKGKNHNKYQKGLECTLIPFHDKIPNNSRNTRNLPQQYKGSLQQ